MLRLWASTYIVVILAALIGPVYSPDFAERQPFHAHLHVQHAMVRHIHPYELPHSHDVSQDQHGASHESCALLPSDGAAETDAGLASASPMQASSLAAHLGASGVNLITTGEDSLPSGTSFAPLKPPPRAAL